MNKRVGHTHRVQAPWHPRVPLVLLEIVQPDNDAPTLGAIARVEHAVQHARISQGLLDVRAAQHDRLPRAQAELRELAHEIPLRTQLGEHSEWGELTFDVVHPVQPEHVRPRADLSALVRSSAARGSERGVSRPRGAARRGKSNEREASVLKGSEKFLMREIARGPRSVKQLGSCKHIRSSKSRQTHLETR